MKRFYIKEIPTGLFAVTGLAQGFLVGIFPCYWLAEKILSEFSESKQSETIAYEMFLMATGPILLIALMAITMAIFFIVNALFGICVNLIMKISKMAIAVNFYESSELRPTESKFAVRDVKAKGASKTKELYTENFEGNNNSK